MKNHKQSHRSSRRIGEIYDKTRKPFGLRVLRFMGPRRFERPTSSLSGTRSNQLSYEPVVNRAGNCKANRASVNLPRRSRSLDFPGGISTGNRRYKTANLDKATPASWDSGFIGETHMAIFSVILLTAPPPGQATEAGGAYIKVDGRESLLRAVELFLNRDNVKQVQLVFTPDMLEEGKRKYGGHLSFSGVKVLSAGPKWIDQMIAAGEKVSDESTHVLIHDAARPAVAHSDIEALLEAAEKHPAVALATPARTTLVEIDEGGNAMAFHSPRGFMQLLTPQVFTKEKFLELAKAKREAHASEVTLLKGSPLNIRVGGSGDAGLVSAMLKMLPKPKVKPPTSPFEEAQW